MDSVRTIYKAFIRFLLGGTRSILFVVLVGLITTTTVALAYYTKLTANLPDLTSIDSISSQTSTKFYDRTGEILLYEYGDIRRQTITIDDIPQRFIEATLAVEDHEFFEHPGFSLRGIVRSLQGFVLERRIVSGGSTLTQQVVKNTLLTNERTLDRKVKELILAIQLEQQKTKNNILETYCNTAPYGGLIYGCATAAEYYFATPLNQLSLAQLAFLAGLPQAPSLYLPSRNTAEATTDEVVAWLREAEATLDNDEQKTLVDKDGSTLVKSWKKRQVKVLLDMAYYGYITQDEAVTAIKEPLAFIPFTTQKLAPHFVDYVQDYLVKKIAREQFDDDPEQAEKYISQKGLKVITTLDFPLQERTLTTLQTHRKQLAGINASNAAMVVLDAKSGEILAMQGSIDYYDQKFGGQVNVLTSQYRQPGSSMKPLVYAYALEEGYTPAEVFEDKQTTFPGGYKPRNYDYKFHGIVNMRMALANSYNIPAVLMIQRLGVGKTMKFLHKAGITTLWNESNYGLSLALGGGEVKILDLSYGFSALANKGVLSGEESIIPSGKVAENYRSKDPACILEITDNDDAVLYTYLAKADQIMQPSTSFIISSMLSDNAARTPAFGAINPLNISKNVAVKTGTDSEMKDIVTIGFTPSYVVGVWAGNNDRRKPVSASGANGAAPIWNSFMRTLLDNPQEEFEQPENVVAVKWGQSTEYFVVGTKPAKFPLLSSLTTPTGTPEITVTFEPTINPSWYVFTPISSPQIKTPVPTSVVQYPTTILPTTIPPQKTP